MRNNHNTINNIEFPAKDLSNLREFYGNVFGWTFKEYGEDYLEFTDGQITGGFNRKLDKGKNGPLIIIYSEGLEKSQKLIEENNGTITVPTFSFPGGRRFHFKDIEGNELAVWSE